MHPLPPSAALQLVLQIAQYRVAIIDNHKGLRQCEARHHRCRRSGGLRRYLEV